MTGGPAAPAVAGPSTPPRRLDPSRSGLRSRFVSAASWSLGGAVVSRGMTLVGSVGAARLLGSAGLGELGMVQSTANPFAAVAGLGLGLAATKLIAESRAVDPGRLARQIGLSLRATAISSLVLSAVYLLALPCLGPTLDRGVELAGPMRAATGLLFFGALSGTGVGILAGFESFRTSAVVAVARCGLTASMLLVGVKANGVEGAVWGLVIAEAVGFALIFGAIRSELRAIGPEVEAHPGPGPWGELWRFGVPALLGSVVVFAAMWASNAMLIRQPGGYWEMGRYSAAFRWNQLLLFVPSAISGVVLPMLSNRRGSGSVDEARHLFRLNVAVNVVVTIVPAVPFLLLARPLMAICGEGFEQGWPTLVVLSASALPTVLNSILGQRIVSEGKIWRRMAVDCLLAATLVASATWLVPAAGATGLALAYAVANTAASLALYLLDRARSAEAPHAHAD